MNLSTRGAAQIWLGAGYLTVACFLAGPCLCSVEKIGGIGALKRGARPPEVAPEGTSKRAKKPGDSMCTKEYLRGFRYFDTVLEAAAANPETPVSILDAFRNAIREGALLPLDKRWREMQEERGAMPLQGPLGFPDLPSFVFKQVIGMCNRPGYTGPIEDLHSANDLSALLSVYTLLDLDDQAKIPHGWDTAHTEAPSKKACFEANLAEMAARAGCAAKLQIREALVRWRVNRRAVVPGKSDPLLAWVLWNREDLTGQLYSVLCPDCDVLGAITYKLIEEGSGGQRVRIRFLEAGAAPSPDELVSQMDPRVLEEASSMDLCIEMPSKVPGPLFASFLDLFPSLRGINIWSLRIPMSLQVNRGILEAIIEKARTTPCFTSLILDSDVFLDEDLATQLSSLSLKTFGFRNLYRFCEQENFAKYKELEDIYKICDVQDFRTHLAEWHEHISQQPELPLPIDHALAENAPLSRSLEHIVLPYMLFYRGGLLQNARSVHTLEMVFNDNFPETEQFFPVFHAMRSLSINDGVWVKIKGEFPASIANSPQIRRLVASRSRGCDETKKIVGNAASVLANVRSFKHLEELDLSGVDLDLCAVENIVLGRGVPVGIAGSLKRLSIPYRAQEVPHHEADAQGRERISHRPEECHRLVLDNIRRRFGRLEKLCVLSRNPGDDPKLLADLENLLSMGASPPAGQGSGRTLERIAEQVSIFRIKETLMFEPNNDHVPRRMRRTFLSPSAPNPTSGPDVARSGTSPLTPEQFSACLEIMTREGSAGASSY